MTDYVLGAYLVAKGVVRRVRTPAGAKFFKLPIGSPITSAAVAAAKMKHGAKGLKAILDLEDRLDKPKVIAPDGEANLGKPKKTNAVYEVNQRGPGQPYRVMRVYQNGKRQILQNGLSRRDANRMLNKLNNGHVYRVGDNEMKG